MTGRVVLITLLLAAGSCSPSPRPVPPGQGENLLLVTLDTVRADHLGVYGGTGVATPTLDRMATEGVRFATAISPAPLTLPAHATLLSGLLPPRHGLHENGRGRLPQAIPTLATRLEAAGYRTGAFVGAFVLDRRFGLGSGFEVYDDDIERDPSAASRLEAERPGSVVVDRALAWLDAPDERPFFAWLHLYDAHAPHQPPEPFASRYRDSPYDGEIATLDAQVARLLELVERRGWRGRTLVAVAGDHGEGLGDHDEEGHGLLLYEATLHVPLILWGPGWLPAGRVVESPVSLADLAPTVAALLALPAVPGGDGRDLGGDLLAGREPAPAEIYSETDYPRNFGWSTLAAVRRGSLKYISAPRPELYDLAHDPGEHSDLLATGGEAPRDLVAALDRLARASVEAEPQEADAETRARLATLGYVAGSSPTPAGAADSGKDPKDFMGLFRRLEQARLAMEAGRLGPAIDELTELVASDRGNPVFRGTLAEALRRAGQSRRAVAEYRQVAEQAAEDPQSWYNLGVALEESGDLEGATAALARALHLRPDYPEAYNTLGVALSVGGKSQEALEAFTEATRLDPRNATAQNNLGNALRGAGRLAEAESAYRAAVELAPRYADPLNGLGTLAVLGDRPAAAIPFFDAALALSPGLHEARLNRAIALEMTGDRERAITAYRDFLVAAADDASFAAQRRTAEQLLTRLGARPPSG